MSQIWKEAVVGALGRSNGPVHDVNGVDQCPRIEQAGIVAWARNRVFHNANDDGSHTDRCREFQGAEVDQNESFLCCESVLPEFCDVPVLFSSPKGPEKRQ